jgi:predicted amidophosphoribosyltransferase
MPVCPNCGNQAAENAIYCDQCGTRLPVAAEPAAEVVVAEVESTSGGVPEGILICPSCGAENVPGEVFCDACGEPLEAPEPAPSEAVAAPAVVAEVELETVLDAVPDAEPEVEAETVIEAATEAEGEPVAVAEQTYCPVCGASVRPGDTFCGTCGASLSEAAEEQTLVEEPVIVEPAEEAAPAAVLVEEEPAEEVVVEGEAEIEEPVLVEEGPLEEAVAEVEGEAVVETVVVEVEPEPAMVAEEPLEEVVVAEAEVVIEAEEDTCPVCGASVLPDQRFCASCGAALPVAEAPVPTAGPAAVPAAEPAAAPTAIGPYLEVADSGAYIPLIDQPELLIGRVDDVSGIYPDIDMTPHGGEEGGVSRRHAQLLYEGDAWFVVDLDSTNGTYVNGTETAPHVRVPLQDGDRIGLGDLEVVLHTA